MDGRILDPEGAHERLAAWRNRIDELAAGTRAMGEQLQQVSITARDPGGLSEVTVDSTGAMVGLRLTDRIGRVSPDEVARTIMATLGDARAQLADRSQEIIAATMGTESAAARAISESVAKLRPARPAQDDDEGFENRSYREERW